MEIDNENQINAAFPIIATQRRTQNLVKNLRWNF